MIDVAAPAGLPAEAASSPLAIRESYASLSAYEVCPRRYAFRYVERLPGSVPPGWYTFGSAVHHAFEAFDRARIAARQGSSQQPGFELLRQTFESVVGASGCEAAQIQRLQSRGEPVLRSYAEHALAASVQPIAVELGFGVNVSVDEGEPPVRLVGYIDRIDRRPDGGTEIVDHKTGGVRSQEDVDADSQLTAYAFAGGHGALADPSTGETLPPPDRLGLHFPEAGVTLWTRRSTDELHSFGARLAAAVRRIRRREFAPDPGSACRWCEYRQACPDVAA